MIGTQRSAREARCPIKKPRSQAGGCQSVGWPSDRADRLIEEHPGVADYLESVSGRFT